MFKNSIAQRESSIQQFRQENTRMSAHAAPQHLPKSRTSLRSEFRRRKPYISSIPMVSSHVRRDKRKKQPTTRSLLKHLCDFLEDAVDKHFSGNPLKKSVDPEQLLVGFFAPVEELPPTSCAVVKGAIPDCLRGGAYIRNGPNPRKRPHGAHHLFDGDGMLQSLLFESDGARATLCARYCRTTPPLISKIFGLRGVEGVSRVVIATMRIISGQMDRIEGLGPASTSVSFFWDKIFVHGELDQPFSVYLSPESGELCPERNEIGRRLPYGTSVHYQHDQSTGDLFTVSYSMLPPFLTLHCYDKNGNRKRKVPIWSVPRAYMFHDFSVTKNYVVIPEIQLFMNPLGMIIGDGSFMSFDRKKSARVGVIHRDPLLGSEMRWFDVPGFYPLHVCNAWEEDNNGTIVVIGSCPVNIEHMVKRIELVHPFLEMVRIDLKPKTVTRTVLSAMGLWFTAINPTYKGRKTRYLYAGISSQTLKISGVAKLDLELAQKRVDCVIATREFGPGVVGGEPFFVPRKEGDHLDEDDGFLLMFIHDETKDKSKFIVMETKSPELEVVVEVELPQRVPFGFHGVFVSRGDLACQSR